MHRSLPAVRYRLALAVLAVLLASLACASESQPRIEEFPELLPGVWVQVGGPDGTMTFEGTVNSGVGRLSAEGIQAVSFTWQWVAPAMIRTTLGGESEFVVLFEDGGDILVLSTVSGAGSDEVLRYSRREE